MTTEHRLLDDAFAAFIDENATGLGLPASERRYRTRARRPTGLAALLSAFEKVGRQLEAALTALQGAIEKFGRDMAKAFLGGGK
jgi:hypothetical protein